MRGQSWEVRSNAFALYFLGEQCLKLQSTILAPLGLKIVPLSPTALNLTILPAENPAADYYVVNFKGGKEITECTVYASDRPYTCIFAGLKPHTMYTFEYYAGAYAPEHDIVSEIRQASGSTPPERKSSNNFLCLPPNSKNPCCFCRLEPAQFVLNLKFHKFTWRTIREFPFLTVKPTCLRCVV